MKMTRYIDFVDSCHTFKLHHIPVLRYTTPMQFVILLSLSMLARTNTLKNYTIKIKNKVMKKSVTIDNTF